MKNELNKLYNLFLSRHPTFRERGNVSIIAHSLGSVIAYDILERWDLKLRHMESSTQNRFVTDSINYFNSMEENRGSDSSVAGDSKDNPIHVEFAQAQLRLEELNYELHNQMSGLSNEQNSNDALQFKVCERFHTFSRRLQRESRFSTNDIFRTNDILLLFQNSLMQPFGTNCLKTKE